MDDQGETEPIGLGITVEDVGANFATQDDMNLNSSDAPMDVKHDVSPVNDDYESHEADDTIMADTATSEIGDEAQVDNDQIVAETLHSSTADTAAESGQLTSATIKNAALLEWPIANSSNAVFEADQVRSTPSDVLPRTFPIFENQMTPEELIAWVAQSRTPRSFDMHSERALDDMSPKTQHSFAIVGHAPPISQAEITQALLASKVKEHFAKEHDKNAQPQISDSKAGDDSWMLDEPEEDEDDAILEQTLVKSDDFMRTPRPS